MHAVPKGQDVLWSVVVRVEPLRQLAVEGVDLEATGKTKGVGVGDAGMWGAMGVGVWPQGR
jgi:hypothetical protein